MTANNIVFIVMDSCRYDSFMAAATPNIDRLGEAQKRYSYASWTAPSHYAFTMGMMPHASPKNVYASEVYKEEFLQWKDRTGGEAVEFKDFLPELSLPRVLAKHGYRTVAKVSMPVLNKYTPISKHFDEYKLMDNHNNFAGMIEEMEFPEDEPHYYFLNLGETHYPYMLSAENLPHVSGVHGVLKAMGNDTDVATHAAQSFDPALMEMLRKQQIKCVEYVDGLIGKLMAKAPPNTWFIVTADHGELFGEDGYFGHGPVMHEKCFEVPFVEGMLGLTGAAAMTAPLFLLAPPRSYTSLVNAMLGQHPQAFGLPELCLFNVEILVELWTGVQGENAERGAMARHGLLRAVAEIYGGEQTAATVDMARCWASAREDWSTGRVFQEIVEKIHPLVAVEKSPSYAITVNRMRGLLKAFPDARFLHLVRHPVAQSKSVMAINGGAFTMKVQAFEIGEDYAMMEPQIAWHDVNLNIMQFLEEVAPEQQIRMRGEDIMGNPEHYLAEICRWAGLRDDADAVEQMMHPERSPFACFGPISAMFGNDPNFLSGPTFRPHKPKIPPMNKPVPWREDGKGLYPEVIDLAKEFGYE